MPVLKLTPVNGVGGVLPLLPALSGLPTLRMRHGLFMGEV
jgi:hypothetical protein